MHTMMKNMQNDGLEFGLPYEIRMFAWASGLCGEWSL